MTKQYENNNSAPVITPARKENKTNNLEKRIKELDKKIQDQDQTIHRMHRDIVRLRVVINDVVAKLK